MISEFARILGILINIFYEIVENYGLAIILFTIFSKIILFPINIIIQKNSIKMIKIRPEIEELKYKYSDDREKFMDEQIALFEKEKYKPSLGIIPLLIQIPIILSLVKVLENSNIYINNLTNIYFLGIDLSAIPTINSYIIIPILAAISCILLCILQNKSNVLQKEETTISKLFTTTLTTVLTIYFIFLVPSGVGLYWIVGNILSIFQIYILNAIYPPKKYIDYEKLKYWKELNNKKKKEIKENKRREKEDYKRFFDEKNFKDMKLIFYSEKSGFYKYFEGIIDYILKNSNITIHYVTSDPNDNIFNTKSKKIKTYYIGKNKLISLFMKIEADIVVMTTPDLQKYYLKRSLVRKDVEYIYLDHGMTSVNLTLRTGALDYFDTIFANGPEQVKEIREIEELRQTKRKNIIEVGFPFMDNLIEKYENNNYKNNSNKKTILIAPSHQEDNILESCIDEILEKLIYTNEYKIIVRPHPQFIQRNKEKIDELLEKYKDKFSDDFYFELDFSSNETIYLSDLVITDWSGIGLEYSLSTAKPTLYINTKMKVINKDYQKIETKPLDISIRNKIGKAIEKEEISNIKEIIDKLIINNEQYIEGNKKIRKKYIYNIGISSKVGAEYIINKIEK